MIGNVENCVVICTFLSIVICLDNLMFDGRTCFRPFELKYKMYEMFIFPVFLCFLFYHIHFHLKKVQNSLGNASQNQRGPFCNGICSML